MNWNPVFARRTASMRRSAVRELLRRTSQPGMISFAGGLPAKELFPVEEIASATATVLRERSGAALQYGETEGVPELRDWVAARYNKPGCPVTRDNVLIVAGSQQALDLVGRILLDEGDHVLVENPTYLALLAAWRPLGVQFEPLGSDAEGALPESVMSCPSAKCLYVVPSFQNPQGTTMSLARRQEFVRAFQAVNLPVLEDNPYGELCYDGEPMPHLLHLDATTDASGHLNTRVIHLGTFSKVLAPGLRVGWVVAAAPVIERLVLAKQAADLHTSTFCQHIILELLKQGTLERQLPVLRAEYGKRRDTMLSALERYFPKGIEWTKPTGGMFLMIRLPDAFDVPALFERALARNVAFVPGEEFHIGGAGKSTLRLNFSYSLPEVIEDGMKRLAEALAEMMPTKS